MDNKYLKSDFQEWMKTQKKVNGEPYSENTINSYVTSLKNSTQKLQISDLKETDLFYYLTTEAFTQIYPTILSQPNFNEIDIASGNKAYSCAMKLYAKFLGEQDSPNRLFHSDSSDFSKIREELIYYGETLGAKRNNKNDYTRLEVIDKNGKETAPLIIRNATANGIQISAEEKYLSEELINITTKYAGVKQLMRKQIFNVKSEENIDTAKKIIKCVIEKAINDFSVNYYWLNVEPSDVLNPNNGNTFYYNLYTPQGQERPHFKELKDNDKIIGYVFSPDKNIRFLLEFINKNDEKAKFAIKEIFSTPISFETLQNIENLKNSDVIKSQNKGKCLFQLSKEEFEAILSLTSGQTRDKGKNMIKNIPLNQILYGPPGTGKTYNTVIEALKVVMPEDNFNSLDFKDRKSVMAEYKKYKEKGQIKFVTFHQSYSYEEFVESIKPVLDESCNDLKYERKDGILKQIADLANTEYLKSDKVIDFNKFQNKVYKLSLGDTSSKEGILVYDYCIEKGKIAMGWGQDVDFSNANSRDEVKTIYESSELLKQHSSFTINAVDMFKNWIKEGDLVLVSKGNKSIRAIGRVTDNNYIFQANTGLTELAEFPYCQFRNIEWLLKDVEIPAEKLYEKNISQMSIYQMTDAHIKFDNLEELLGSKKPSIKNYVLIIDEINRGNISKIFGELITLLEDDKRLFAENEITLNLPYSENEKDFGLPPNLYFIGTMNTSDRSIASVDIALRRRFKFKEIMPDSSLVPSDITGLNADFRKIFEKINEKICILLDREHQIGHSYFMKVKTVEDLKQVWFDSIIPLLNEYFYGEWEKLQEIIPKFVKETKTSGIINKTDIVDDTFFDFYKLSDFEANAFFEEAIINLYKNNKDTDVKELAENT